MVDAALDLDNEGGVFTMSATYSRMMREEKQRMANISASHVDPPKEKEGTKALCEFECVSQTKRGAGGFPVSFGWRHSSSLFSRYWSWANEFKPSSKPTSCRANFPHDPLGIPCFHLGTI